MHVFQYLSEDSELLPQSLALAACCVLLLLHWHSEFTGRVPVFCHFVIIIISNRNDFILLLHKQKSSTQVSCRFLQYKSVKLIDCSLCYDYIYICSGSIMMEPR